jgi:hypothetical protein
MQGTVRRCVDFVHRRAKNGQGMGWHRKLAQVPAVL